MGNHVTAMSIRLLMQLLRHTHYINIEISQFVVAVISQHTDGVSKVNFNC